MTFVLSALCVFLSIVVIFLVQNVLVKDGGKVRNAFHEKIVGAVEKP